VCLQQCREGISSSRSKRQKLQQQSKVLSELEEQISAQAREMDQVTEQHTRSAGA